VALIMRAEWRETRSRTFVIHRAPGDASLRVLAAPFLGLDRKAPRATNQAMSETAPSLLVDPAERDGPLACMITTVLHDHDSSA
jgi:hypothetical protein